jgi:hemolysin D
MVLAADLAELDATRDSLRTELHELDARHNKLEATIKARTKLLAVLQERVDVRNALDAQGQGYRAKVIDALQQLEQENTNYATDQGELAEIEANKASVEKRIVEATEKFISEQASKFAEAQEKKDRLSQELIKAATKEKETRLIAPISGVVQQLSVTTLGQVVAAGQSLMTIVPDGAPIEVEALIQNQDIGFVTAGQPVTIKIEAFPFTRYGTLEGTVLNVSRDGVDQRTAANLSDAPSITKPQGVTNPTNTTTAQPLAFPARISIARSTINIDGHPVRLLPGMAVTAEVKTGQRRAIDYVLSPLREVTTASLQER